MSKCIRVVVSGRVHGVGFRVTCAQIAQRFGVSGTVRNRPDGTVEIHAEGPAAALDSLVEWCRVGPTMSQVTSVDVSDAEPTGESGFRITR